MTHIAWQLFVLVSTLVGLLLAYSLAVRIVRTIIAFFEEVLDTVVGLLFVLVIVPMVWVWEKAKRPMWRTLTKEQTQDLEAWLKRATR